MVRVPALLLSYVPLTTTLPKETVKFAFTVSVPPMSIVVEVGAAAIFAVTVTLYGETIITVSPAAGTPLGLQVATAFQLPLLMLVLDAASALRIPPQNNMVPRTNNILPKRLLKSGMPVGFRVPRFGTPVSGAALKWKSPLFKMKLFWFSQPASLKKLSSSAPSFFAEMPDTDEFLMNFEAGD